ncbi:branched-chain amino acid transport system substrate-binding protein [Roseovarius sp. MBR-79]|jgi:branched-chain amino acid transport system substrate-binding protein
MKKVTSLALATAMMLTAAQALACEVKVGVVGPFSGGAAQWGLAMKAGAELAAAEFNAKGGIKTSEGNCDLILVEIDTQYAAQRAAAAADALANQGIKVVLGPIGSPEVSGIKPMAARHNMLLMLNSYAKDAIGPQWPLAFHVSPGPSGWALPIVRKAKERFDMRSVVIVAPNDQGGTDIAPVVAKAYRAESIEATEEYFQRGTTDFAAIVTRVLALKPDAVDLVSSPTVESGTFAKQLRLAGFTGPIGKTGGPGTEEISRIVGGYEALGDYYYFEPIVVDEAAKRMATVYKDLTGKDAPEHTFFYLWGAASRIVFNAIEAAGSGTDAAAIAEALRKTEVNDPDLGEGQWIGQSFFGINQELSLPFGMGFVANGKVEPLLKLPAAVNQ